MDYEKMYKEALKRVRRLHDRMLVLSSTDALVASAELEFIFPELAESKDESEDERIRKLLVWQVYRNIEDETNDLAQSVYDGIKGHDPDIEESIEDWKRCLAWLEKQKEQKHILKFKVGDKVHLEGDDVNILTITGIEKDRYLTDCGPILFGAEDIWQIVEQKPAECERQPEFKEVEYDFRGEKVKVMRPFFRDDKGREFSTTGQDTDLTWSVLREWCEIKGITPFDLYPRAEWSEEDEDMLNSCISSIEEAKENRYAYRETDGDTSYDHEISWLKSLRPSWKPSEEQMAALQNAVALTACDKELVRLYNQLKKL